MLWGGGSSFGGGGNDDDAEQPAKRRRTATTPKADARGGRGRGGGSSRGSGGRGGGRSTVDPNPPPSVDGASTGGGTNSASSIFTAFANTRDPATRKKQATDTKELDRSEAVVLQANQLKHQIEDSDAVMQLSMSKCTQLLEKIDARLRESSKNFVEMIKAQGPGCRAETVYQSLNQSKSLVQSITEFVEALQDKEAAPATLQIRVSEIQSLGVTVPLQVKNIICQRTAQAMVEEGKLQQFVEFLDHNCKEKHPEGIHSILPTDLTEDGLRYVVKEFQSGCITFAMNHFFLKEFSGESGCFDLGFITRFCFCVLW